MDEFDLAIIGGGINGAGIARDAAGRGLSVLLCEQGDFGGGTSSASSKLIHGGLRYLEQHAFRLVAESLAERERLLNIAPQLINPLQFVLPQVSSLRSAWKMRVALWLYDHMGGRHSLPRSHVLRLSASPLGEGLRADLSRGFSYWDAQVDDARLVIANLQSAFAYGAQLHARTKIIGARRTAKHWELTARDADGVETIYYARMLVNAAGPWVDEVLQNTEGVHLPARLRLVKGSHIVVPRIHAQPHAYVLQNPDRRIIFMIPFQHDYTLIGTTDLMIDDMRQGIAITPLETRYLLDTANMYLRTALTEADIRWSYCGVRPLYDDGSANPSTLTRDYHLLLDERGALPLLAIFGGKLTSYRKLAEAALQRLSPWMHVSRGPWTASEALPGGDFARRDKARVCQELLARYAELPAILIQALFDRHGTRVPAVLGEVKSAEDLGLHFGADLYEREVRYFIENEWAHCAQDVLWRRTKAGLRLNENQRQQLVQWFEAHV